MIMFGSYKDIDLKQKGIQKICSLFINLYMSFLSIVVISSAVATTSAAAAAAVVVPAVSVVIATAAAATAAVVTTKEEEIFCFHFSEPEIPCFFKIILSFEPHRKLSILQSKNFDLSFIFKNDEVTIFLLSKPYKTFEKLSIKPFPKNKGYFFKGRIQNSPGKFVIITFVFASQL